MGKRKRDDSSSSSSSSTSNAKRRRSRHCQNGPPNREEDTALAMAKKRKKWRGDSSSDTKRRRSRPNHIGANDGTPMERMFDAFRDTLLEFKDAIQVRAETKKEIDELKEKGKKYEAEIGILKEDLRILKESHDEVLRILKEGHKDRKSQIQEMQKGRCAEVAHYRASPSQRSQPSESPRYNLQIENIVCSTIYKRETVTTVDGSGQIKVAMYDGNHRIASNDPLASVKVDLLVINGSFNNDKQDSWSREDFAENIIKGRHGKRLLKNDTFCLIDGSCHHKGAMFLDNSQQKEYKLGVRVAGRTEVRVLEGVSNPFKVQEIKTKIKDSKKKDKNPSPPVPTPNLVQPTSTHATQHGQGPVSADEQHNLSPPAIQDVLQKEVLLPQSLPDRGKHTEFPSCDIEENNGLSYPLVTVPQMVVGNGHAQNGNGQNFRYGILEHMFGQPTSANPMQHVFLPQNFPDRGKRTEFPTDGTGEDNGLSYTAETVRQLVEGNGQALNGSSQRSSQQIPMQTLWMPTSTYSMQHGNLLQAAGHCSVIQPLLTCGQDKHTSYPNASSQLAFLNQYEPWNDIQSTFNTEDRSCLYGEQMQETNGTFRCGRVLLQLDNPHVELKKHWNFFDQLMPLYSRKSRFYTESFPSTSLMDIAHKLLASIPAGNFFPKMITSGTSQAMQIPKRRGVLIRSIRPYDSDDEPPVIKKQRSARYQLRFVNRVCSDYYTREQIKSEDGSFLKVALYDENNLVVTSGLLSSACVEVVLLHGDFNAKDQDYWTSEEFSTCLVQPQSAKEPPALGGDHVLALTDGEADIANVDFQISSFHARTGKFKMGAVIKNVGEASVQEGITHPFLVRVRLGEEPRRHGITSPDELLGVKVKLPSQVRGALEEDESSQLTGVSMTSHRPCRRTIIKRGLSRIAPGMRTVGNELRGQPELDEASNGGEGEI